MLVYPSGIDVSNSTMRFLAHQLRGHRRAVGSRWRRLSAGRQAHLRGGHPSYIPPVISCAACDVTPHLPAPVPPPPLPADMPH